MAALMAQTGSASPSKGLAVLLEASCDMVWWWGPGQAAVKGLCGRPWGAASPLLGSCIYVSALGLGLFLRYTAAVTPWILMHCAGSTPGLPCHHGFASQLLTWWLNQVFVTRPPSGTVGPHSLFMMTVPLPTSPSVSAASSALAEHPFLFAPQLQLHEHII